MSGTLWQSAETAAIDNLNHKPDSLLDVPSASFQAVSEGTQWHQVNLALVRCDGSAVPSARTFFHQLTPVLATWRNNSQLHHCFFMRKPPDVRLRFRLRADDGTAVNTVCNMLDMLVSRGSVSRYDWSQYQPEYKRFGGPATIDLAHASFTVDTMLWMQLDRLDSIHRRCVSAEQLLPAVLHHMFQCCCGVDHVIEPWRELAKLITLGGISIAQDSPLMPASLEALAARSYLSERENTVMQTYQRSNEMLGAALSDRASQFNLELSTFQLVASIALFTLNRHGVDGARSGRMASQTLAALGAKLW